MAKIDTDRYMVVDWELQSIWITDDLTEVNEGGSCRYGDIVDLIRDVQRILSGKELKALKEKAENE